MPDSAAKKAWMREHTQIVALKLNRRTDADIIEKLDAVGNKQGYIKSLIRENLRVEKKED